MPGLEIWTETVRRVYAKPAETEVIRYARPDGTRIRTTLVILSLIVPANDIHHLAVHGIAENGDHVKDEFSGGVDEYPDEITSLLPELIKGGEAACDAADEKTLSTGQVAREFRVTTRQVMNWEEAGILKPAFRTPAGQRRYRESDITRARLLGARPVRSSREDVSTEEIIRLRDIENLFWKEIGAKFGMSAEGVRLRYNTHRAMLQQAQSDEPQPKGMQDGLDES